MTLLFRTFADSGQSAWLDRSNIYLCTTAGQQQADEREVSAAMNDVLPFDPFHDWL
jgi:hypothetical protein